MFLDVLMIYNNKIFKDILKIFKNELISVGNIRILWDEFTLEVPIGITV